MGIPRSGDSRRSPTRPPPARPRARRRSWRSHLGSTNLNDDTRQGDTPSPTVATTRSWKVERGSRLGVSWVNKRGCRGAMKGAARCVEPGGRCAPHALYRVSPRRRGERSRRGEQRTTPHASPVARSVPGGPRRRTINGCPRAPVRSIERVTRAKCRIIARNLHTRPTREPCPRRPSRGDPSTAGSPPRTGATIRPRWDARWP